MVVYQLIHNLSTQTCQEIDILPFTQAFATKAEAEKNPDNPETSDENLDKDDGDIVYVATNMATPGDAADPSVFNDPCYVTQMSDYPEWSETNHYGEDGHA